MKFKTLDIENQYYDPQLSAKLRDMVELGERFTKHQFNKELTITEIFRTQESQDEIYGNNPKYQEKPWKSVHQYWRGIDLRVWDFTEHEIEKLTTFFNCFEYDPNRPEKKTCLVHNVGAGLHYHLQVI